MLVVLGLIAGISMPRERMVLAAATVIALPLVGAALGAYPDDRRTAKRGNGQSPDWRGRCVGKRTGDFLYELRWKA